MGVGLVGCPAWARTRDSSSKGWRATTTPRGILRRKRPTPGFALPFHFPPISFGRQGALQRKGTIADYETPLRMTVAGYKRGVRKPGFSRISCYRPPKGQGRHKPALRPGDAIIGNRVFPHHSPLLRGGSFQGGPCADCSIAYCAGDWRH